MLAAASETAGQVISDDDEFGRIRLPRRRLGTRHAAARRRSTHADDSTGSNDHQRRSGTASGSRQKTAGPLQGTCRERWS